MRLPVAAMWFLHLFVAGLLAAAPSTAAVPYAEHILAPKSRTLFPATVHSANGSIGNPSALLSSSSGQKSTTTFSGSSALCYDFGRNIAGLVSFAVSNTSSNNEYIGVTFSESSMWVSNASSDTTSNGAHGDEILWFHITSPGNYTAPREKERGGFRYLTLVHNGTGSVGVDGLEVHFTAMPHWADDGLGNYAGWFHCDDELLNRIWYAGAYTNQLCTIDPKHGNAVINFPDTIWYNNYTIANGTSTLVDGAKRDRLVWAGDMGIAVPSIFVSTNDMISVENGLNSLFDEQASNGQLPWGGRPLPMIESDTYQLYTLIGVANHYLYTADISFLTSVWPRWKLGLTFALNLIDSTGLMDVPSPNDWLRSGMGGHNIEANSILYHTLYLGIELASAMNDTSSSATWGTTAEKIKTAANALLWKEDAGMYIDNENSTLMPQDGNSWAIVSSLTQSAAQASTISAKLASRWTPYGAPALEAGDAVSPFVSGFEIQAHYLSSNASAALALMRLQWGFMLNDPRMTNSTFIEGYSASGAIHYPPYSNDARISHAHGWATGPTSTLTFYAAGIQILSAGGKTWRIEPALGDLKSVDAGVVTPLGTFSAKSTVVTNGVEIVYSTPPGTSGEIGLGGMPDRSRCKGKLVVSDLDGKTPDTTADVDMGTQSPVRVQVAGGRRKATFSCN